MGQLDIGTTLMKWCAESPAISHCAPVASTKYRPFALIGHFEVEPETVNETPLLETPLTVATTGPVVAPVGTGAAMLVALQLVGVAAVPLNVTVLEPCDAPKFVPMIVTDVPTGPELGLRFEMAGAELAKLVREKLARVETPDTDAVTV